MDASPWVRPGWAARLELTICRENGMTRLVSPRHVGPLRIQKPFYPEGRDWPHLYLLHPPGGIVGGDQLDIEAQVQAEAGALLTTPAAQKLYRSPGPTSRQMQWLVVGRDAVLEWLPAETIVFDGARATQTTEIDLDPSARLIAWEITCFGRPASDLGFETGRFCQRFSVRRGGSPLFIERLNVDGGSRALTEPWGYRGLPVFGSLYLVDRAGGDGERFLSAVREDRPSTRTDLAAATAFGEVVVLRVGGISVERVRARLTSAWRRLRPELLGRAAAPPRIWAT